MHHIRNFLPFVLQVAQLLNIIWKIRPSPNYPTTVCRVNNGNHAGSHT